MKSGRLTSLINEEQLKELEPRSSHWVSDLLSLSSHRQESLVPRCNSSTNAVAGKSLLEMTLSTTASAAYSQHNGLCEDNQRMARLLGADLNESSMSWTSSLATPIVSSFVVTPLPNSTSGSLKKDPTNGSGFLLPSLTPRAPLSNKQDGRTMQRSSGRRIQVCPRTLFSASSLLENSNTSLSVDAGNKLVSDAELIAVSFEDEPSEGVKKDSQGIVNCQNLHQGQPITTSNAKVNESSVIGNLSDDALSVFFQSPEVGTRRKLRRVPKQRAKRKYVTNLTSGLELSPNVGHSLVSESEHCDVSSNTNTLISHQKICAKTSGDTTEPQTSAITGMILENSETVVEDAIRIESTNASTASSICNKMAVKTTNSVLESGSQMLDFSPAEVTTRIVSTVRPIFSRNHSKLQSPINIQSRCVNQSFSDLASSPFIVLPECASTPIRVLTKVKEHQDKNLSSGDADRLHPRRDSGTGQMNRASDSVGSNHGVGFSGVSVDAALGTSSSSKRCSEANSQDVLQSLKKPRKFVYPTAAQIARTCPKKVFSFQSKPVVACENSQNRVLENKKPDVSFHSLKHCVLPAAYDSPSVFPSAKESTCRLITSDAHLNPISEGEQKSSCMGKTSSDDNTLLKLDAESAKTSIISTQSSLPSKSCFSDPKPATAGTNQVPLAVNSSKNLIPIADTIYTKHENRKEDLALSVHATASTYIGTASVETVGSESRHELCFQELVGFRMASGKQVTVSETALVKAENLLNDVIFDTGLSTFNTQPSQKAGGSYLEGADLVEKRSTEDGNSSRAKPCHSTNFVEPYTNATESLLNSADGYDMSDGSCRNDKVVCMSNVAHRKSNTVSVDFKSAGGKSLSVSSAAEAKAKKIIETALEELIDDGSLLDDASLATRGFATGIGVEFKSTGKNKISSSHTNFPDSSSLAAGNACNLTTFDTSRSAFQHADGIRDRHCNRLKQENLPKGFRPFKTPRVFIKKNNEHGQYQGELKGGKLLEVHDEKEISNEVSSDPNLIHKFSSEICSSSLTNTQLAEVADVSWLLQHQVDLLSTQTFNSATLHRHGYEEASEGSMRILSDGAQKKDVGTICEISGASGARTSEKDSICDDNMDIDCAMAWDVVNDDGDQSKNKPGILDCEVLSVVPDCGTEEVKQLMYHVANTAFDNSMEFVSASDQHDVESKVKFQVGFQTAKGNPVKISSAALEKAKCFLSDTSCDVIPTESESNFPMGFQTAKGNPIKISSAALEKAKCIVADTSCDVIPTEVKSDFPIGFQTAKGNPVKISSAVLEKAKCFLSDTSCDVIPTESESNFPMGFQTAKGNPIKISSAALEKAKCILADTSCDVIPTEVKSDFPIGFQTAKGNSIKISPAAMEKAKCILADTSCDVIPTQFKSDLPIGFQTAKGNPVKISSAALEKAKCILADTSCDVIPAEVKSDFPMGFQTAKGNPVKISSAALEKAKCILADTPCDVIPTEFKSDFPMGFQTAKGNSVKISSAALEKAKCILADTSFDVIPIEYESNFPMGFQTAKGNPVEISSAALEKAKCILADTFCDVIPTESESNFPMGFQTAKGNPVKISSAALEKAKCILADTSCDVIPTEVKSDFPIGFQTAKGNPVKISSAALEKAKCVLDDTSCDFLFTEAKVNFPIGFQTAKGNPVKISSAALEEAKCVLSDTSFENKTNSSVKIGFAALEKAESFMFESSCDVIPSESKSTFPIGFQTAKGNMVKISSAALEKAKNVLNDTCDVISSDLDFPTSFQTANEHPVKVNSAAFDESETFLNDALYDVIANESVPTFPFDLGTPKGIPVCASSEALDNTQNLFSMSEGDEKSFCDHVNQKTEDLAIVSDCLKNSKEEGASLDPVRRSEMPASVFHDVNDWTGSTDEDLLAAEVGPSAFDSTDLLSPGLAVRPSFGKDDKCGEKEQLRELPSHTHAGILKNCDRQYGRQQFSSFTTIPESFKNDRQGAMKYIDEVPVRDKKPGGASSQHFRLLTALWTYPESEVTSSSTIVINKAGYPVSADVNSNVATGQSVDADSKQTAKFFTPYKKLPPQNLDKAVAVLDVSTPVDVRRNIKPGPQFSVASKYDLTLSKGEGCSNVTNTTETLSAGDEISCIGTEGERTNEKCSDSSRAAAAAVADDGGALHSNMSGHQQTLVSVCEKVRELRRLAREKQLARVASKNQNQNVRPYPGQLWMARKKGSGVTRIPMGSAVSGKKPASYSRQQLYSCGVLNQTMSITARNAEEFYFDISETFSTETAMSSVGCHGADGAYLVFTENGRLGKEEFCNALMDMPGVAPYLISRSWVYNHFRWIVWKLAAMEVAFPEEFAGRCLTPNNVMMQLKYRYDREVDHSQRSAVKKIFEKDDTSRKTLVLCVSSIFSSNSLELTDGWYSIKAMLDGPLSCLVAGNKIRVGDKICVFGSDLVGLDDATTPLEAPDDVALKICANSTRLAKWDTRLGFLHVCRPPKFPIVSVYPDGGMVGCLDVVLTRIYPIQYLEKLPDGSSVMRTSSSEQRAAQEHEKRREKCIEKLSNRLEQKFEKEWDNAGATPKTRSASRLKPSEIHSAVEIYESYRHASDPGAFESCLTTEQLGILRKHIDQEEQRRQTELQECLQSIMSEADDLVPKRNVTPLLKIQIAGCSWQDLDAKCQAFFTIWRPSEEVVEMLKEGSRFLIFNVSAGVNRVRNCQCKVSFTSVKSTKYEKFPSVDKNFLDLLYEPRRAVNFEELRRRNFIAKYGEVDVAGIVIHVTLPSSDQQNNNKGGNQHTVYLVDDCEAFLAVKFWGGMPLHDVQDSLTVGQVVSFTSLRSQSCCGSVPCAYYSDLSAFSVKYHQKHMRVATDNLASWVKSSDFLSVMTERLTDLIMRKSGADDQLKEDLKMPLIPSIAKDSSIKRKVHFSGLRQVNSRSKQSSNQKPVVASTNSDNFEESAQGNNLPPSECVSSEGDCDKLPLHCNAQACSVPTNEKPTSNVSGIETIDWCDDSAEEALLQASSSGIVDVNSENLLSADDTRSFKRTRKRMRIETETMPQRKSSRLK